MDKHFYDQLKIENFRGIKSLEIDDLARVNLFVGKNNCGKTSVLESAFLLTGMSNPAVLVYIENRRGLNLNESSHLRNFFYSQKYTEGFRLFGRQKTESRELNVGPIYGDFNVRQVASDPSNERDAIQTDILSSATDQSLNGLKFIFTTHSAKGSRKYEATIRLVKSKDDPFRFQLDEKYKETTHIWFLGQTYGPEMVDRMLNEKNRDVLVNNLQYIEPKVQDIRIGLNGIMMVDIGMDNFFPINHLGGGMVHILNILSTIHRAKNEILIIDEIENGLHVSSIKHMWDMVLESSKQNNTQIFMTTHSSDVIKGLRSALQGKSDSVACFWLSKLDDDRIKAYRYSPDRLEKALDAGIDIRQ